jgi:hypothetical protein
MPIKNNFLNQFFLLITFSRYTELHHFSKIKSQKESQNSRNQAISYYFLHEDRRIQTRIRIRIRESQKHMDPDPDPDPQHWKKLTCDEAERGGQ